MFAEEHNCCSPFSSVEKDEERNTEILNRSLLQFWVLILQFLGNRWKIKLVEVFLCETARILPTCWWAFRLPVYVLF